MDLFMNSLMEEEYHSFDWDTQRFFGNEEIDYSMRMGLDAAIGQSGHFESSSPEGGNTASSSSSTGAGGLPKNIVMESKRRHQVNERLYARRGVVPNITKMDKAWIIKDAIDYIQLLQEKESRMSAEISEIEMMITKEERVVQPLPICEDNAEVLNFERMKDKRTAKSSLLLPHSPLEVLKCYSSRYAKQEKGLYW